jgi:hypothetical protein
VGEQIEKGEQLPQSSFGSLAVPGVECSSSPQFPVIVHGRVQFKKMHRDNMNTTDFFTSAKVNE